MSGRITLIGGGVRSGKSAHALQLAFPLGARRAFVATAAAWDEEMRLRIKAHTEERGKDFTTIEEQLELPALLERLAVSPIPYDVVVIDCLTLWVTNLLLQEGPPPSEVESRIATSFQALQQALAQAPFDVILVTNEVGMGIVPEHALARAFRDHAGRLHQLLAADADEVHLAVLGVILRLKPGPVENISLSRASDQSPPHLQKPNPTSQASEISALPNCAC